MTGEVLNISGMLFRFFAITTLCFGLATPLDLAAQEGTAQSYFQKGLQALKDQEHQKAQAAFQESLKLKPENPYTLFNLGLVSWKLGKVGWALAAWRRARALAPDFKAPQKALEVAEEKGQALFGSSENDWESLRGLLVTVSWDKLLFLTLVSFFAGGWMGLRYLGQRRRQLQNPTSSPPTFPWVAAVAGVFFLLGSCLLVAKTIDQLQPRGTIISEGVALRSGPNQDDPTLFELQEGSEVFIQRSRKDWIQVQLLGGLTGWIPKQDIFQTSGKRQW